MKRSIFFIITAGMVLAAGAQAQNNNKLLLVKSGSQTAATLDPSLLAANRTFQLPSVASTAKFITDQNLTDIVATGIVAAGTWNGNAVGAQYGGTGLNTSATLTGGLLYTSATGVWSVRAGNTTATKQYLSSTGSGGLATAPVWGAIAAADVPVMVASGASHAAGLAPDPGVTAGTTKFLREDATWAVPAGGGGGATSQSTPADPTARTSVPGIMAGLAGSITPSTSGKILIVISGNMTNGAAGANTDFAQIRYGTGAAPANNAALTGTAVGNVNTIRGDNQNAADRIGFSCNAVVTGLTVGTAYWIDLAVGSSANTNTVQNISISVIEL